MLFRSAVLLVPDMSQPFEIQCDGSVTAIGAALLQRDPTGRKLRPVAYASRQLSSAEQIFCAPIFELLAVSYALATWGNWLMGAKEVTIRSDCKAWSCLNVAQTKKVV